MNRRSFLSAAASGTGALVAYLTGMPPRLGEGPAPRKRDAARRVIILMHNRMSVTLAATDCHILYGSEVTDTHTFTEAVVDATCSPAPLSKEQAFTLLNAVAAAEFERIHHMKPLSLRGRR